MPRQKEVNAEDVEALAAAVLEYTEADHELEAFCTEATLKRYLAARKNKLPEATKMLRATLEWRKSYRPQDVSFQEIRELAGTGRLEVLDNRDLAGRPVLCYRLSRLNVKGLAPELHLRFMLFNLEAASKLADENGIGKMTWLMDMDKYDRSQSVPLGTTQQIISILQNHYPERLGLILIMRANIIFRTLFHIIKHFLDPVTRQKLIFLDDTDDEKMKQKLTSYIAAEHLTAALSCRNANAPFDIDKYESRMADMQQRKPIANGRTGEDLFNRGQM